MQRQLEKNGKLRKDRRDRLLEVLPLCGWVPDMVPILLLVAPQVGARVPHNRKMNVAVDGVKLAVRLEVNGQASAVNRN